MASKYLAVAAWFACTAIAAPAMAQMTINGTLRDTDPTAQGIICFPCSTLGGVVPYNSYAVTISDGTGYGFDLNSLSGDFIDLDMALYSGAFDPADVLSGVAAYNDDSGGLDPGLFGSSAPVAEGQYTLVVSPLVGAPPAPYASIYEIVVSNATLGWGPSVAEEIASLAASANAVGRIFVVDAHMISRLRGEESLATRDEVLSFTRLPDPETGGFSVSRSTMDHQSIMGDVYAWVDLTGFRAEDGDGDRSYSGRGIQFGADMALGNDMVVGLSLGVQDFDSSVDTVSQDGVLRFLQPYLAYRSGAWSGEVSLIYGLGDYDQSSAGGDGEGETRLGAIAFTGNYDIALEQSVVLTPTLGLTYGSERIEGVSGTLAGAGTETVRFTEASLGAEISRTIAGGGEVFAGLHADWLDTRSDSALVSDLLVDDGWTGRFALGLTTEVGNGIELDTSLELSGFGGDLRQSSGSLRLAVRF